MTDPSQARFRLPHFGWFLLATVVLVVSVGGLSIWLPYQREQQLIQRIESWGGAVDFEITGSKWVRRFVGSERMREFKVFNRVRTVYVWRDVSPSEIAQLNELTNLRTLGLCSTAVTDDSLVHLCGLTNLQILDLYETAVSDVGLVHLRRLKSLKHLMLNGTGFTADGVDDLKAALPHCWIPQ